MTHSVDECVKSLACACRVNVQGKTIRAAKGNLGLHRLGMVDYLVNHCGWTVIWD